MNPAQTLVSRRVVALMAGFLAVFFSLAGCSEEGAKTSRDPGPACASGEVKSPTGECVCPAAMVPRAAGGCQPAGLPLDMPCPPGEMLLPEGGCEPAGVPPEACAEGFEPDGKRGCNAIQPEEDCPEGLMAIPGETKCREVAPCGSGTWGDIPVEADTVFVDGSYSGGGSNGTKAKPWTKIQTAINSSKDGAIVAIAAGSYNESLLLHSHPVRLWGRCPSMVEVVGADGENYAIQINKSHGAEVRSLAILGPAYGLAMRGSVDVVLDHIWLHHTGGHGVYTERSASPASLTVSSSLIEAISGASLASAGTTVTLSRSVVRDTVSPFTSSGVVVRDYMGEPGSMTIRNSVISRTHNAGVAILNASVQIDATLIRDIQPVANGWQGQGVFADLEDVGGAPGELTIRASVIEDTRTDGIEAFGIGLTIEATVIRGTRPDKSGGLGRGVHLEPNKQFVRGSLTIRGSLVENNHDVGISVHGADALIEGTIVRDTKQGMNSTLGLGVTADYFDDSGDRAEATIRSSVIQGNVTGGIVVVASDASIETSIIADTKSNKEGDHGIGIAIQGLSETLEPARVLVRSCRIERNIETGVAVVSSDATIETSHVRDVQPNAEGAFGDGIVLRSEWSPATAQLYGTRVESSARAGIASFGGLVVLDRDAVTCTAIHIDGEVNHGTDFIFDDRGGTACGCPEATDPCLVLSSGLQPPPIDDL